MCNIPIPVATCKRFSKSTLLAYTNKNNKKDEKPPVFQGRRTIRKFFQSSPQVAHNIEDFQKRLNAVLALTDVKSSDDTVGLQG